MVIGCLCYCSILVLTESTLVDVHAHLFIIQSFELECLVSNSCLFVHMHDCERFHSQYNYYFIIDKNFLVHPISVLLVLQNHNQN